MNRELNRHELIERSMVKKYRKKIWSPFINAVKRYQLIRQNDKIAICISGGKDSMLMAKLMQQLQKHSEVDFDIVYLVMDPGYSEANRQKIESNAELLHIPITIFESNIFEVANSTDKSPCYLCARMRRGHLYAKAQELGCNKIALGHHMSDVIETTLLGMLYGSQIQGMLPRLKSTNFSGMELIRPLYCILEEDVIAWKNHNELDFLQCACRFTENNAVGSGKENSSKRLEIKNLIKNMKCDNPNVEINLFNSIHRVNIDTLIGYKLKGTEHSFLERFAEDHDTL